MRSGLSGVCLNLFIALGVALIPLGTMAQPQNATTVIVAHDEPISASPRGDQTLRLAGPLDGPESLDPAFTRDLSTAFIVRQIFRGLTRFDDALQPVPELASRIEISADGREYTFTLRENAVFQDGRRITADDVVYSLQRALDPATAGGDASLLAGPTFLSDIEGADQLIAGEATALTGVTAIDPSTVRIRLAAPRATFLMKLASIPASIVDRRDVERGGDWWRTPNGSGPFRVAEWSPGSQLVLAPSETYFAGPPPLQRIVLRLGASAAQPFNLYESDQIDITGVDVSAIDRVLSPESGLSDEVTVTPLFNVDYLAFRTDVEPLSDPHIRRALFLGFPREKIAKVTYGGYVTPAQGFIPDGMLGVSWPARMDGYDLMAAREEIAKSSYGSPERVPVIRIYSSGYAGAEAFRDSIQDDLGLRVEVINVEWNDYVEGLVRRQYPAYELYWGADYPDPESLLLVLFGTGRADNYVDYANERFNALLAAAAAEQDPAKRIDLYRSAQQILLDDYVVIPLYFDVSYTLAKPWVKGLTVTPLGILGLERVWLEH
jgi:peptide/nickel transport system substrate-binding protein/oligopeptide transport system substrate-binding protein